ncbi:MAG: RNA-processing protein [Methanobacteriota archaeon]|nr:MAG: RNA-processing protein [Euryarchaeota archaeon]
MEYVRIAEDRIGSLIGKEGEVKSAIEKRLDVSLDVDSRAGMVTIRNRGADPLAEWKARDMVRAINYGIDLSAALRLSDDDHTLVVIDLSDIVGRSKKAIVRQKARIIGRGGKTKAHISGLTDVSISIKGRRVALVGRTEWVMIAKEAVEALAGGLPHGVVYKALERKCSAIRMQQKVDLWRPSR